MSDSVKSSHSISSYLHHSNTHDDETTSKRERLKERAHTTKEGFKSAIGFGDRHNENGETPRAQCDATAAGAAAKARKEEEKRKKKIQEQEEKKRKKAEKAEKAENNK